MFDLNTFFFLGPPVRITNSQSIENVSGGAKLTKC